MTKPSDVMNPIVLSQGRRYKKACSRGGMYIVFSQYMYPILLKGTGFQVFIVLRPVSYSKQSEQLLQIAPAVIAIGSRAIINQYECPITQ